MLFQKFLDKYNGKFIDYDKRFGNQCMDLMRQYVLEVCGFNPYDAIPASPTARQCFNSFKTNKYFTKVINTPSGVPKKGDIIFWGWRIPVTGMAGHVAIVTQADVRKFVSFDQNYPTGMPCGLRNHDYRGILGWLSPNTNKVGSSR